MRPPLNDERMTSCGEGETRELELPHSRHPHRMAQGGYRMMLHEGQVFTQTIGHENYSRHGAFSFLNEEWVSCSSQPAAQQPLGGGCGGGPRSPMNA